MIFVLVFFLFFLFSSCTEDYRLQSLENSKVFVVDGCITDEEGPYLIRLAEYMPDWARDTLNLISFPVTEARVRISDDVGNMDELKPLWKEQIEEIPIFFDKYSYFLLLPTYHNDYVRIPLLKDLSDLAFYEGVYYTTSISGVPGRTYTLSVEYGDKTYTASDRMPYGTVLDSVVMRPVGVGEYKDEGFYVPFLYFPVPQDQENFYFFSFSYTDSTYNSSTGKNDFINPTSSWNKMCPVDYIFSGRFNWRTWNMITVSDRFMSPYMANYKMGAGSSSSTFFTSTDLGFSSRSRGHMDVYMGSVSKPVFNYLEALSKQFFQDGGAFSHAPASPPSNISNGGQGVFMATSVSVCRSNFFIRSD
jgi:hypothetical protein